MQVKPVFTGRTLPVYNSINELVPKYKDINICSFEKRNDLYSLDKSVLYQKFNFHDANDDGISTENKTYDSFTGLRDKNYLLAALNSKIQNAKKENKELSTAMFDMDDFKSVNELLGYETGDIFIKEISREIAETTGQNNVDAYRFGGEEFILIFSNHTEEEKAEIAKEIAEKVSNNATIRSYKNLYMRNAQSRLDKAVYSTSKIHKISELETKKETLAEVMENLSSQEAKNDPYFEKSINGIDVQIKDIYKRLIHDCLVQEHNEKNRDMLLDLKSKLNSNILLTKSEQKKLDEYLYSIYDKSHEIHQTKKWISDFRQNDGFGFTCGIVNFEPQSLNNKSPMYVVETAGQVLKEGKNDKKGEVYFKTVSQ